MTKVLMVISESPPIRSGVARVAEKLSQGLRRRGMMVDILSLSEVPRLEIGEIRLSSMLLRLGRLKQQIRNYDLIHLHGPVPTFSDVFLLWCLHGLGVYRPQLVYTHHAPVDIQIPLLYPLVNAYNQLQERLAGVADHVVASSPAYAERLSRFVPDHKLSVIPWGVDHTRFFAPVRKNGPFTVVYLGQVRPYKGLPVLLKAVSQQPGMRVWVIGDGHYAAYCHALSHRLDIQDIKFWGQIPDEEVIRLMRQAHVLVMPSVTRSEAFGLALLEGMSAGLVPIGSHLPGVADLIDDAGYTFPPGDHLALRGLLTRLRDDNPLRVRMALIAQARSRTFSWNRTAQEYDQVFCDLLSEPGESQEYASADFYAR